MRKLYFSLLGLSLATLNVRAQDPSSQAPAPINNSSNVLAIFSDPYGSTNLITTPAVNTFRATGSYITVNGSSILKLTYKDDGTAATTNYSQTEFTTVNATGYDYFHIDVYNPASGGSSIPNLTMKIVDYGPNNTRVHAGTTDNKEGSVSFPTPAPGTWGSYNFKIDQFLNGSATPLVNQRSNIGGILITTSEASNLYIDNVYFSSVTTLPLHLTSFIASVQQQGVNLKWTSANETRFEGFEVERKTEATDFSSISFIKGGKSIYSFTDDNPENGQNYYRLKMIDDDGTIRYSNIVNVKSNKLNGNFAAEFFPNPVQNELTVNYSVSDPGETTIALVDALGRKIKSITNNSVTGKNTSILNTADLGSGLYLLQIDHNQKTIYKEKIFK